MRDEGVVMTFDITSIPDLMLSEDGADGMGCGTAAYEKTSRGRPQSIHSSYIFNLYTMILSPNQTRLNQTSPKPRHGVVPAEKINQRGGNNGGWGSWSIIAAAAGAVAVALFCWR